MGSIRESVLLLLLVHKDRTEHAATRLLTQVQVNPEAGAKAYEEYVKVRYPYLETTKQREHEETIKRLNEAVKAGPLVVRQMGDNKMKSHMKKKIDRISPDTGAPSRLMKKIGRSMPL